MFFDGLLLLKSYNSLGDGYMMIDFLWSFNVPFVVAGCTMANPYNGLGVAPLCYLLSLVLPYASSKRELIATIFSNIVHFLMLRSLRNKSGVGN